MTKRQIVMYVPNTIKEPKNSQSLDDKLRTARTAANIKNSNKEIRSHSSFMYNSLNLPTQHTLN